MIINYKGTDFSVSNWDWKNQPQIGHILNEAMDIKKKSATGEVFVYQPETGEDSNCCVVSPFKMTEKEAIEVWVEYTQY